MGNVFTSKNRFKSKICLVGKKLYERVAVYIESCVDRAIIRRTSFSKGNDFDKIAKKLGI